MQPIKGRAYNFNVALVSFANTKALKSDPVLATGDIKISKDGGAFANITTLPTVTQAGTPSVKIQLSATEMTADSVDIWLKDAAGDDWCELFVNIKPKEQAIGYMQFVMRDTAGNPVPGKTVTAVRLIDGGSFAAGNIGAVVDLGGGLYSTSASLSDMNGESITFKFTATGCMPTMVTVTSQG